MAAWRPTLLLLALPLLATSSAASRARLQMSDDSTRFVAFPDAFTFPMAGVRFPGVYVNSNGNLTFGAGDTSYSPGQGSFLTGAARIAPLWVDLNPGSGGTITAGLQDGATFVVRWDAVPVFGGTGTCTLSVSLSSSGAFSFAYGAVTPNPTTSTSVIIGFSGGRANTNGAGTPSTIHTTLCPTQIGTGSESAIFQVFTPPISAAILSGTSLCFAPVQPMGFGLLSLSDDSTQEVAIGGFAFPFFGNLHRSFWVNSNGSLSFGGGDVGLNPTGPGFLNGVGRIAAFWTDLNPSAGGSISYLESGTSATVTWTNVPEFGTTGPGRTFAITFSSDGSFSFTLGSLATISHPYLTGISGGYAATTGTEPPVVLATQPSPIPSGNPAVWELYASGSAHPLANTNVAWTAGQAGVSAPLSARAGDLLRFPFPAGFAFPFAGGTYTSAFISPRGWISFGLGVADGVATGTAAALRQAEPRIAAFWTSQTPEPPLSGGAEGNVSATGTAGQVTVSWTNVPTFGGANTFSVTLLASGGVTLNYGTVTGTAGVVGLSGGASKTVGSEAGVNVSALPPPVGLGPETAIFEEFTAGSPFDLANQAVPCTGLFPVQVQGPVTSPGTVPLALGAGAANGGRSHVAAASLGSLPGIQIAGCATIPLNLDGVLLLSLAGILMANHIGTLDGMGQSDGWPQSPPIAPGALLVPAGLSGLGVRLYVAFVAYPGGGGCPLAYISPASTVAIP